LSAIENAGRSIEDKEEQVAISNIGIGTPSTKASIIETLLSRNYIIRKSKALALTDKGTKVHHLVKDKKIANVQMTAEWEMALDKIEKGELDSKQFIIDIKDYTTEITKELLSLSIVQENIPGLKCPNEQCNWMQFRNVCGVQLSVEHITSLINNRRTQLLKNMKTKNGKKFNAFIVLMDDHGTAFKFENS
jgi:DNA topoisomerase-3